MYCVEGSLGKLLGKIAVNMRVCATNLKQKMRIVKTNKAGIGDRNGELVMLNFAFFNSYLKPGKSSSEY